MPDPVQWLLLAILLSGAGAAIAWPLIRRRDSSPADDPEREAIQVRHRLAVEALRDAEADRRAGSLDEAEYERQRAEAEERAMATLHELRSASAPARATSPQRERPDGARVGLWLGAVVVAALVAGFALPPPIGLAERTRTDQALADQLAAEQARQHRIGELTDTVAADPRDVAALSELADLFLAGTSERDLNGAIATLLLLRDAAPRDRSAHRRLITALIGAGLWEEASTATDRYAAIAAKDDPDIPFFRGVIALRGVRDAEEAIRQFDRFLSLAPGDPRETMVRSLRLEAAHQLPAD
jgi:cytochrome c-type biogenesis protein CcmI